MSEFFTQREVLPLAAALAGGLSAAVIAISGIGPIAFHASDPTRPGWRAV